PILVKVSYFPNWEASGAEGPWRITPNLMVVVPTAETVELTYGRTGVDLLASGLTVVGVAVAVLLARRPSREWEPEPFLPLGDDLSRLLDPPDRPRAVREEVAAAGDGAGELAGEDPEGGPPEAPWHG